MSAIEQMLRDVAWDELDILVIDVPPGTVTPNLPCHSALRLLARVVSTSGFGTDRCAQGPDMFRKVNVPLLGIIENMSHFICTSWGAMIYSVMAALAPGRQIVPFLGEVPLEMAGQTPSDEGTPVVASQPDSVHAQHYSNRRRCFKSWTGRLLRRCQKSSLNSSNTV